MSQNIFFSIIIPTLNEQDFLPQLLADLKKQTCANFEVILVDGGSTDNTTLEAKKFESFFPLRIFVNKKKSVSMQRNLGAEKARGQYLVFFDADVGIPPNFVSKLQTEIEDKKGHLYTTRLDVQENSQTQLALVELTNFIIEIFNTLGKPFAPGFDIIMEREFFLKLKGFDPTLKLAEDHDIVQRARKAGVLLQILKEPVLYPSFRRPERIGYLKFITQYAVAGLYTLTGEPIKKDLFSYPMGGHLYDGKSTKTNVLSERLTSLKKTMAKIAKNIELPF